MIPIVLCIDVEPDAREPEPGAPVAWDGWETTLAHFTALRTRLRSLTGRPVHFNWFLRIDPQIEHLHGSPAYIAERDRARFAALAAEGDSFGLHPHLFRRDDAAVAWIVDFADWPWIRAALRGAAQTFHRAFGHAPENFRFGDGWMSAAAAALLPSLGIRHDLSLEPGRRQASRAGALPGARGAFPATETVPRHPYRPSRLDYRRPGRLLPRPLWMIPITTLPRPAAGGATDHEGMNLVFAWGQAALDRALAERAAPFLIPVLRTGDIAQPRYRAGLDDNLALLLGHGRAAEYGFMTPAAFIAWYRGGRAWRRSGGTAGVRPV